MYDLLATLRYLPYGLIAGLLAAIVLDRVNSSRQKQGKNTFRLLSASCLIMYVVILLAITFFSREMGS